jgi:hypothetical protein
MDIGRTIVALTLRVTKNWARQRMAEERHASSVARRRDAMIRSRRVTVKEAAWEIMPEAYMRASENGPYARVAHARQIMYAGRDHIQRRTERMLDDQYFTQTLLPDYLIEHPDETADWDVVFDARGHFTEPHTKLIVPLGTLDVRRYLKNLTPDLAVKLLADAMFPTRGPRHRFQAILFIEKEGFMPHFAAVRLAERYDIAIMSTKGLSVTASRHLVDTLCAEYQIPLFVLHDFDKSGFSILGTLQRDTRRYAFKNEIMVIDLGLRLEDVEANGLQPEQVSYGKSDPTENLRVNGATEEEIAFLLDTDSRYPSYSGQRVELNSFTTGNLIAWIEAGLKKHGIAKWIPDKPTLDVAYRRAMEVNMLKDCMAGLAGDIHQKAENVRVPESLVKQVNERLRAAPALPWDAVIAELAASRNL